MLSNKIRNFFSSFPLPFWRREAGATPLADKRSESQLRKYRIWRDKRNKMARESRRRNRGI